MDLVAANLLQFVQQAILISANAITIHFWRFGCTHSRFGFLLKLQGKKAHAYFPIIYTKITEDGISHYGKSTLQAAIQQMGLQYNAVVLIHQPFSPCGILYL